MDLPIRYSAENIVFNLSNIPGRDSPSLKLCCLSFQLVTLKLKALLEENTVIVELGECQPS